MRAVTRFLASLGALLIMTIPALSAQHPQTREGFWIGFGFGYGSRHETCAGWGFTAGTGYDIRVGRNVSLTPVVNFAYGHVGDLSSGGTTVDAGWKQSVIDFALGVTFH